MSTLLAEDRLAELDRKIDFLVEEVANLRRLRQSGEDLAADLMLVGRSMMGDAVNAFGTTDLHPDEIVRLVKAALANARLFETVIQQLQSAADFLEDAQPIFRDGMNRVVQTSQALQEKGYFAAAAAGVRVGDAMIRSHSAEDWRQVEASVPQMIGLFRELTRPEVLKALEAIIHGFGRVQATMDVNKSMTRIARDLGSADARRGMAIIVEFLKVVGAHAAPARSSGSPAMNSRR